MNNRVRSEISPAQAAASLILMGANLAWVICVWIWLWMHTSLSGNIIGGAADTIIAGLIYCVCFWNATLYSPINCFFNEILVRGGGYPTVSIIAAVLMTAAIIISLVWFPAAWIFWGAIGLSIVLGVPFCENITYRFD